MQWSVTTVAETVGSEARGEAAFTGISTDSRTLRPGNLFVALTGLNYDAHDFLEDARRRGATGAVVRRGTPTVPGLRMFEVDDPLRALGALARRRRLEIAGPVVGVTGTNGKTSTKEFLAAALRTRWRVHATRGNLNNEIGVPLTMLSAPDDTEALVVEAGANQPGEIARLRAMIEPSVAVITNVSAGHVEGFGSEAGVLEEKLELVRGVPQAVVGLIPPALAERARTLAAHVRTAGLDARADVHPTRWELSESGHCRLEVGGHEATLGVVGPHQGENAMLAIGVARALEIDPGQALEAIAAAQVPGGRCTVTAHGALRVIDDTYNANPASMAVALDTAQALRGNRPLVILVGTMRELGSTEGAAHEAVADAIVAADPTLVGAVGAFVPALERHRSVLGDRLLCADDPESLGRLVAPRVPANAVVLLKASRGVRLERAIPYLHPDREAPCSTTS